MAKRKRNQKNKSNGAFGGGRSIKKEPTSNASGPVHTDGPGFSGSEHERFMDIVQREMAKQDFANEEEAEAYFSEYFANRSIDEIIAEGDSEPDPHFDAIAILDKIAGSDSPTKIRKLAKDALDLDPHCVDAYLALAVIAKNEAEMLKNFGLAVKVGEIKSADAIAEVEKGNCPGLWLVPRARPYLEALRALAHYQKDDGEFTESRITFEKILKLNPDDNRGARHALLPVLILLEDFNAARLISDTYPDDESCAMLYGRALLEFSEALETQPASILNSDTSPLEAFKTPGFKKAREELAHAIETNPWGAAFIIDPRISILGPLKGYRFQSPEEALECGRLSVEAWILPLIPAMWLASEVPEILERPLVIQRLEKEHENFTLLIQDIESMKLPSLPESEGSEELEVIVEAAEMIRTALLTIGSGGKMPVKPGRKSRPKKGRWLR